MMFDGTALETCMLSVSRDEYCVIMAGYQSDYAYLPCEENHDPIQGVNIPVKQLAQGNGTLGL